MEAFFRRIESDLVFSPPLMGSLLKLGQLLLENVIRNLQFAWRINSQIIRKQVRLLTASRDFLGNVRKKRIPQARSKNRALKHHVAKHHGLGHCPFNGNFPFPWCQVGIEKIQEGVRQTKLGELTDEELTADFIKGPRNI